MSRSFKHTPVTGNAAGHKSEKQDKKQAHKALRAHFRTELDGAKDLDAFEFDEHSYAHSERNTFSKGGKQRAELNVAVEDETGHVHVKEVTEESKDPRKVHKYLAK